VYKLRQDSMLGLGPGLGVGAPRRTDLEAPLAFAALISSGANACAISAGRFGARTIKQVGRVMVRFAG